MTTMPLTRICFISLLKYGEGWVRVGHYKQAYFETECNVEFCFFIKTRDIRVKKGNWNRSRLPSLDKIPPSFFGLSFRHTVWIMCALLSHFYCDALEQFHNNYLNYLLLFCFAVFIVFLIKSSRASNESLPLCAQIMAHPYLLSSTRGVKSMLMRRGIRLVWLPH